VAEHRLSLAVNGQESLLHQRLITYRAGVGLENGRQLTAGSVAIVGLGYVGLPTAVALHGAARRIIGIDSNEQRLRDILAQDADLGGPDQERLAAALTDSSLELTTDPPAVKVADAVIICVPTAEATKLYENIFRAVSLALANEFADACGALSLDPIEVTLAASTKPYGFLGTFPGPGVGGHCIPCDPHYLLWQLNAADHSAPLIEQAMKSIALRPKRVIQRAAEVLASEAAPDGADWDLAVAHTLHPRTDYSWAHSCPRVLDGTYQFFGAAHRAVV
jgi:UDP-N-acetyl-D-mannosaminuronate dehydrogenase